jgi:hypothetical protein
MAITNGYVTLAEIRGEIGITVTADTADDTRLEVAVEAASRAIDSECGRRFYLDANASARYYTAEDVDYLRVDDIGTATGLVVATDEAEARTYAYTWASTDYDAEPYNALADGKPVTSICRTALGVYVFPRARKACKITAKWGWPSVPTDIKKACMIEAVRLYKRRDAAFGQTGSPETGVMNLPALDPDVKRLIAPYRKMGVQ